MTPEKDSLHGLNCPRCGGVVPIPEGEVIVRCPYCDLRSFVKGERGLRRYQIPYRMKGQDPLEVLRRFFSRNWAIARDAGRRAQLAESFLVYLPFWVIWSRAAAWAFGQKKVGSGDDARYEPREVRIVQDLTWGEAACDIGEFGVTRIPQADRELEPFEPEALHAAGMVFEPVGSFSEARSTAEDQFQEQIRRRAGLDRLSQLFMRLYRKRYGLVYYPLWVLRYLYHGRAFQVVIDGYSGGVLYGKAPGNVLFRAAILVAGMAVGAFLSLDVAVFILTQMSGDDGSGALGLAAILFVAGIGIMFTAYRKFRYGEQFEYRSGGSQSDRKGFPDFKSSLETLTSGMGSIRVKDIEQWMDRLD